MVSPSTVAGAQTASMQTCVVRACPGPAAVAGSSLVCWSAGTAGARCESSTAAASPAAGVGSVGNGGSSPGRLVVVSKAPVPWAAGGWPLLEQAPTRTASTTAAAPGQRRRASGRARPRAAALSRKTPSGAAAVISRASRAGGGCLRRPSGARCSRRPRERRRFWWCWCRRRGLPGWPPGAPGRLRWLGGAERRHRVAAPSPAAASAASWGARTCDGRGPDGFRKHTPEAIRPSASSSTMQRCAVRQLIDRETTQRAGSPWASLSGRWKLPASSVSSPIRPRITSRFSVRSARWPSASMRPRASGSTWARMRARVARWRP